MPVPWNDPDAERLREEIRAEILRAIEFGLRKSPKVFHLMSRLDGLGYDLEMEFEAQLHYAPKRCETPPFSVSEAEKKFLRAIGIDPEG